METKCNDQSRAEIIDLISDEERPRKIEEA
jgi:hypothetical protein